MSKRKITLVLTPKELETLQFIVGDHLEDLEDFRKEELDDGEGGWEDHQREIRATKRVHKKLYPKQ